MPTLYDSISKLPGLGPVLSKKLAGVGVKTVRDLLWYFPYRYEDYSKSKKIAELAAGETVTLIVELVSISARRSFKSSIMVTEAVVKDETGELTVKWFNQPFLAKTLKEGMRLSLAGTIDNRTELVLVNPHYELFEDEEEMLHTGRIVPVYPRIRNIGLKRLRQAIHTALDLASRLADPLPEDVRRRLELPSLERTISEMHFPASQETLAAAVSRLKFEEVFCHQLLMGHMRGERLKDRAHTLPVEERFLQEWTAGLPFTLTPSQKQAAWEIVQGLSQEYPMNRLLEGDVGSGKTVVAAMAVACVLHAKKQAAYLAPTEILAIQQEAVFARFLGAAQVVLLTRTLCRRGGEPYDREVLKEALAQGESLLVISTHALLQQGWEFENLALLVVDEQHRFGVEQRHTLLRRFTKAPHLLSMTATPIPRSLAHVLYGNLDLSLIREMPKGRQKISTFVVSDAMREDMYRHILEEIASGNRIYVVCPLIDPSDTLGVLSVSEMAQHLAHGPLKGTAIAQVHGRMKTEEKEKVLEDFRLGKTPVLVATTVVEVGMDVPEATVMLIEGAERFGLAQLHQLRGRVGRSSRPSVCFLRPGHDLAGTAKERLDVMARTNDGCLLAERDLEFRGPGALFGDEQSGFSDFHFATLTDVDLIKQAHDEAVVLLREDVNLKHHQLLQEWVKEKMSATHLE